MNIWKGEKDDTETRATHKNRFLSFFSPYVRNSVRLLGEIVRVTREYFLFFSFVSTFLLGFNSNTFTNSQTLFERNRDSNVEDQTVIGSLSLIT